MYTVKIVMEAIFDDGSIRYFTGIGPSDGEALKSASQLVDVHREKNHISVVSQRMTCHLVEGMEENETKI